MTVPMLMPNAAAGNLLAALGARLCGTVASACASSTESIVNAIEHLRDGLADVDRRRHRVGDPPVTIASFSSMQALSKRNDDPETPSPRRIDRDGFVMGEGAGVLILETRSTQGARREDLRRVVGGGVTADSYHITANDPRARGAAVPSGRHRPKRRLPRRRHPHQRTPRRRRSATRTSTSR
jgi:3-oxoacyl-[acyl-carrier-protein] synthase II